MANSILESPKLYLDTCHLIRIARLRKGNWVDPNYVDAYRQLDDCICKRHFGLVFSPWAPLEWVDGNATLSSALEIAGVVHSAALQYEIESDSFIWLREVLSELKRIEPSIRVPEFEILFLRTNQESAQRPMAVLINEVPTYFNEAELSDQAKLLPKEVPFAPALDHAEEAWKFKHKRSAAYQERVDGHAAAIAQDLETFRKRKNRSTTLADRNDWIKRFLRVKRIFDVLNPGINLDSLLSEFDITRCPATDLYIKAHVACSPKAAPCAMRV